MDKISISALDDIMKETYEASVTLDWHGHKLVVLRTLSLNSMLRFVDSVTKTCFAADTKEYMPEAKDFAILSNVVDMYTNVTLPGNLEHQYKILYQTDLIPTVLNVINPRQFNEMILAINSKVKHKADSNAEKLAIKLDGAVSQIYGIAEKVDELFGGLTNADMQNIVGAIAENGGLDEGKIVKLLIDERNGGRPAEGTDESDA